MSRFLDRRFSALEAYVPGEQPQDRRYVKLNTNESPFPPPPHVLEAVAQAAGGANLYCDPACTALRGAAARVYGLAPEQVMAFNGSDEVLSLAFQAWGAEVAYPSVSYGFYPVFAAYRGADALELPLLPDLSLDYRAFCNLGRMVVIANPNAPTGLCIPIWQIEEILRSNPAHPVVVDEAYIAFGGESALPLLEQHENLLITRTFSKSHALAGARLGLGFGSPALLSDLELLRCSVNPYNISAMGQAAGVAALEEDALFMARCREIAALRDETAARLRELGCEVTASKANFLFIKPPAPGGKACYLGLKERGVLVRWFARPALAAWLRVSVGSREQMEVFETMLREVLTHA